MSWAVIRRLAEGALVARVTSPASWDRSRDSNNTHTHSQSILRSVNGEIGDFAHGTACKSRPLAVGRDTRAATLLREIRMVAGWPSPGRK